MAHPVTTDEGVTAAHEPPPVGMLVPLFHAPGVEPLLLRARDVVLGTGARADAALPFAAMGVADAHARLRWCGDGFEIAAIAGAETRVDGQPVSAAGVALRPGSEIRLGGAAFHYAGIGGLHASEAPGEGPAGHEVLLYGLSTLDPETLVERARALLAHAAPSARVTLVASETPGPFAAWLAPSTDPALAAVRDELEHVFACGETLRSGARRVQPVFGPAGHPLAAAVVEWHEAGAEPAEDSAVALALAHVGLAFRNAALFAELSALNRELEARVDLRTQQIERQRAVLVAQDRLATLGRLVAAIAHELNNPVGAIASFSGTLERLLPALQATDTTLARLLPEPGSRAHAGHWLAAARDAAAAPAPDSRSRRALEARWSEALAAAGVASSDVMAPRLARMGLAPAHAPAISALAGPAGPGVLDLAEAAYTAQRSLASMRQCALQVAHIVTGLKTYAHLDRAEAEVADLRAGLDATLAVLHPRVPVGVEIVTRFEPVAPFRHRPGELMQVWTNLLDNALRAVGERGTIDIAVHESAGRIVVEVTDSGPGIAPALRDRIFELDVTTRGPGAGLGLGLPICRTLVEQHHGGRIAFTSESGRTTFRVELPRTPGAEEPR